MTEIAAVEICAGGGSKRGMCLPLNPATGALIIPADLDAEIHKALRRTAYRIAIRFYLSFPSLYFCKFALQLPETKLHTLHYLNGRFLKFVDIGHRKASSWRKYCYLQLVVSTT